MVSFHKQPLLSRRALLKLGGLGAAATALYSYYRGIRFPMLSWEPTALKSHATVNDVDITFTDLIQTSDDGASIRFRAYAPEPTLNLVSQEQKRLSITVNNIAPDATLNILNGEYSDLKEDIQGITRRLELSLNASQAISLKWSLAPIDDYTFAAIGDSGGDKELGWCIQRAHELGARFLLHLGDFNYQKGDYDNAIEQFNQAPLPCYISIGNHDFNESGLIYQQFLNEIGPLNNAFSIGKTRFINLDTAASVLPFSGGLRGQLMQQLIADEATYADSVVFTHRPLHDPMPLHVREEYGDHDIGSDGERDWLINSLKKINATTMLCGHIHIFNRTTFRGIDNIIVGQGLGHQDLMVNDINQSKMALGHVDQEGKVRYTFPPLAMPMELHCHPRIQGVKDSLMDFPHADKIREISAACESQT